MHWSTVTGAVGRWNWALLPSPLTRPSLPEPASVDTAPGMPCGASRGARGGGHTRFGVHETNHIVLVVTHNQVAVSVLAQAGDVGEHGIRSKPVLQAFLLRSGDDPDRCHARTAYTSTVKTNGNSTDADITNNKTRRKKVCV